MTTQNVERDTGGIVGFVDDLNGAIRENPIAAGFIGIGVLWMFFGNSKISAFGSMVPSTTRTVATAVNNAAQAAGSAVSTALGDAAARVNDGARNVADAISSSAERVVAFTTPNAAAAPLTPPIDVGSSFPGFGQHMGVALQQNLTKTLEGQPLLLGAIGLAIGAGIASAFASTKLEQEMIGDAGSAMKDKLQSIANETTERAKEALIEVKKEAAVQGLTQASAAEGFQAVVQKVKTVATTSQENIKNHL